MHRYIFQCNANELCGLGHLMRCLNIADALKAQNNKIQIIFNGEFNAFAKEQLNHRYFNMINTVNFDNYKNATLILDDYCITQKDIDFIRAKVKTFIKIDDFNEFDLSQLNLIINFRSCAESESYSNNNTCLGLDYFPFKKPLIDIRKHNLKNENSKVSNIVIFIGGTDQTGVGKKILNLLIECITNKNIYLIDKNAEIKTNYISNNNNITVQPLVKKIEELYQLADVFITGGGLSKYEVAFCCIPNASISQNIGQAEDTKILAASSLTYDLGIATQLNPSMIKKELMTFLDENSLLKIKNSARTHFSTNSTTNLAQKIIEVSQ